MPVKGIVSPFAMLQRLIYRQYKVPVGIDFALDVLAENFASYTFLTVPM
jgi:hypothetical protein